jgi:hypothetical protein
MQGICARQIFPTFYRIWTDYIQEETRLLSRENMDGMVNSNNDENQALASHTRRGRRCSPYIRGPPGRRASPKRETSLEPRQKKYLSKIICFKCHDFGHYASQSPLRRRRGRRHQASTSEVDDIADRF